ncbi:hypothetical protein ACFFHK_01680 [Gallibacterium trehalosifermentans]|uniref:Uncharacterized protein n=1 Tax=Gallibacterium trehalosifermentans TaxID=516935 RepID=A0ABV6GYG5_9PAST
MILTSIHNYKNAAIELIPLKSSFVVCDVGISEMLEVSDWLEDYIEKHHLTCRVYTKNRMVLGLSYLLNPAWGVLSIASIAAHNFITRNPDYEIARDLANGRVEVVYKG